IERIMLRLRTEQGLNLKEVKKEFDEDLLQTRADKIKLMVDEGMVEIDGDYLRITNDYFYVSNAIIVELL
ncbi:MAG: hypothetical protein MJ152_02730, partial [Clostridia bacterium]|nr:hypothetical protein [Clostridia bacterium]